MKVVGDYVLLETMKKGEFGKVQLARNVYEENELVAIKILEKSKLKANNIGARIKKEITIMKMIDHPCIVSIMDVFATATKVFMVLEFVPGSNLLDKLIERGKFDETVSRLYFKQIVEAIEYCHSVGVCHRGLKIDQFMLDSIGRIKILNFGLSAVYSGCKSAGALKRDCLSELSYDENNIRLDQFIAPEQLSGGGCMDGMKADVWSMGMILHTFFNGIQLCRELPVNVLLQQIERGIYPSIPNIMSVEAVSLIRSLLSIDPFVRLSMIEAKQHPWMVGAGSVYESDGISYRAQHVSLSEFQSKTPSNESESFSCLTCWVQPVVENFAPS